MVNAGFKMEPLPTMEAMAFVTATVGVGDWAPARQKYALKHNVCHPLHR